VDHPTITIIFYSLVFIVDRNNKSRWKLP